MSLAARIVVLQAGIAVRRAARRRRRQLERELAAYSSAADRLELDAILDRHPDAQAQELRSIVTRQRFAGELRTGLHWPRATG